MMDGHNWTIKPENFINIIDNNLKLEGYYIDSINAKTMFPHFNKFYTELLNEDIIDDIDEKHVLFSKNNLHKYAKGLKKYLSNNKKFTRKYNNKHRIKHRIKHKRKYNISSKK